VLPVSRHPNLALQSPRPPIFTGRVWVLIDGGTFSTAAELCAVLRSLRRAVFVGEETGGTYEGNSSGTFAILTLPHSGVRVVVPLVRYLLAGRPAARAGRGVLPDHPVTEAAGEGQGKDRALQRTFELVRAAGRKPCP
jgi:C-terminal processing protease CtpA/Prc